MESPRNEALNDSQHGSTWEKWPVVWEGDAIVSWRHPHRPERNMSFCEIWFSKQLEWWALELRMLQDSIHPWFQLSCVWLLSRELSELSMFYSHAKARLAHPQHDVLARIFGPGKSRWVMYPLEQKHGINMRYFRFTACYGMYMPVWQLYECKYIYIYIYTSCIQYTVYRMYE